MRRWWPTTRDRAPHRLNAVALVEWLLSSLVSGQEVAPAAGKPGDAKEKEEYRPLPRPLSASDEPGVSLSREQILDILERSINTKLIHWAGDLGLPEKMKMASAGFHLSRAHYREAATRFQNLRKLPDTFASRAVSLVSHLGLAEIAMARSNLRQARELFDAVKSQVAELQEFDPSLQQSRGFKTIDALVTGGSGRIAAQEGNQQEGLEALTTACKILEDGEGEDAKDDKEVESSSEAMRPRVQGAFLFAATRALGVGTASLYLQLGLTYWKLGGKYREDRAYCHR